MSKFGGIPVAESAPPKSRFGGAPVSESQEQTAPISTEKLVEAVAKLKKPSRPVVTGQRAFAKPETGNVVGDAVQLVAKGGSTTAWGSVAGASDMGSHAARWAADPGPDNRSIVRKESSERRREGLARQALGIQDGINGPYIDTSMILPAPMRAEKLDELERESQLIKLMERKVFARELEREKARANSTAANVFDEMRQDALEHRDQAESYYGNLVDPAFANSFTGQVLETIGQMGVFIPAGMNPITGAGVLGSVSYQEAVDDYFDSQGLDPLTANDKQREEAAKAGITYAVPAMVLERIGLGPVFNRIFGSIPQGKRTAGAILQRLTRAGAEGAVSEGLTEGAQTVWQNVVAQLQGYDPDREITEGAWEAMLIGATVGGGMSTTVQAVQEVDNQAAPEEAAPEETAKAEPEPKAGPELPSDRDVQDLVTPLLSDEQMAQIEKKLTTREQPEPGKDDAANTAAKIVEETEQADAEPLAVDQRLNEIREEQADLEQLLEDENLDPLRRKMLNGKYQRLSEERRNLREGGTIQEQPAKQPITDPGQVEEALTGSNPQPIIDALKPSARNYELPTNTSKRKTKAVLGDNVRVQAKGHSVVVDFATPLDRALYAISTGRASKARTATLAKLKNDTGLTEAQLTRLANRVRQNVRKIAQDGGGTADSLFVSNEELQQETAEAAERVRERERLKVEAQRRREAFLDETAREREQASKNSQEIERTQKEATKAEREELRELETQGIGPSGSLEYDRAPEARLEELAGEGDEKAQQELERRSVLQDQGDTLLTHMRKEKARLPHPQLARQNDNPLAGDLQALWDAMNPADRRAFFTGPGATYRDPDLQRGGLKEQGYSLLDTVDDLITAMRDEINGQAPMYPDWRPDDFAMSRKEGGGRMTEKDVRRALQPTLDGWKNAPNVKIVQSEADLPARIQDGIRRSESEGDIEGVFYPANETVYLIADNLSDANDARRVLFHETVAHYGLRDTLGEQWADLMEDIYISMRDTPLMESVISRYPELDASTLKGRIDLGDELAARLAEDPRLREENRTVWQRIVDLIRTWYRQHLKRADLKEEDVISMLRESQRRLAGRSLIDLPFNLTSESQPDGERELKERLEREEAQRIQDDRQGTLFSRKSVEKLLSEARDLQERMDGLTAQIERDLSAGRKIKPGIKGQRADYKAQWFDLIWQIEQQRPGTTILSSEPFRFSKKHGAPEGEAATVTRQMQAIESATLQESSSASSLLKGFRQWLSGFKSAVPEIPVLGAKARQLAKFVEGHRQIDAANARVRKEAEQDVADILEPIAKLGRDQIHADLLERRRKLVEAMQKAKEAGKSTTKLAAQIDSLEPKLRKNPFYLFQQSVLYRDLWYRSLLTNEKGEPLPLPGGISPEDVRRRVADLSAWVAEHSESAAIEEALKLHYAHVQSLQKEILDRGHLIPEEARNPLYFPHLVLEHFTGYINPVTATTGKDFRGYLIEPVGTSKHIEANYLRAMYHHIATVKAHNAKQDIVEKYWQPYDQSQKVQAKLEEETGGRVPENAWRISPEDWPEGHDLFVIDEELPMRMEYMIDRSALAEQLGVALGDGDLKQRLKEAGIEAAELTPAMIKTALAVGEKKAWLIPTEMIDALKGIKRREEKARANESRLARAVRAPLSLWKRNILFAPWNYIRYEFNNTLTDLEKLWSIDPALFKQLPAAASEVRQFFQTNEAPSPELQKAFELGVVESVTAHEVDALKEFEQFTEFLTKGEMRKKKLSGLLNWSTKISRLREATFRYAKFKLDLERMRNNAMPVYGGAYWKDVEQRRKDIDDEHGAAYLARRFFGDYGDISASGQWMRQNLIPFYSWMEINLRYHSNLLRNLKDMIAMRDWKAAGEMGKQNARLSALTAGGILLRLAIPYVAVNLWNSFGGAMMGLWDDDEDLESQLSEQDRRRFHLLLGKDENGKVMVVYTPTAFSDVIEWFGGNNAARLGSEYLRGDISLEQAAQDWRRQLPVDLVNKFAQGTRPEIKAGYMKISGKNPFPDVLDQRTVSKDDMNWVILSGMTDRTVAYWLRKALDQDYYSPQGDMDWLQQTILQIRRRDPEQWAYYEVREKADKWKFEKTGIDREFNYNAPDQATLRSFRRALYNGDVNAAIKFYNQLLVLGYNAERFKSSLRSQNPLSGLSKAERNQFYAQMTGSERDQLKRAMKYYSRIAAHRGSEKELFPTKSEQERGEFFVPNFPELSRLTSAQKFLNDYALEAEARRLTEESLN
ncbi:MAG: hypothetical protein AAFX93_17175 [Verrucomicrobiota bacterium]